MIMAVTVFIGANAVCGAATTTSMLIAGRGVQGVGCGGMNMLVDIIFCDLVPLRDPGSKIGLLFAVIMTVSGTLAPLLGGALAQADAWRWIFYMNLPVTLGGLAITMLVLCLRVSRRPSASARAQLCGDCEVLLGRANVAAQPFAIDGKSPGVFVPGSLGPEQLRADFHQP